LQSRHITRGAAAPGTRSHEPCFFRAKRGGSHFEKAKIPMGEIIDKTKGKIKQVAGALAGNGKLKVEGEVDELKGAVKGAVENIKHASKK
jgi:uncharacterized protein YjbJ (UPF0337 family)